MRAKRPLRAGFTLVEVLASLVLVALVIPAAMGGIALAIGLGGTAEKQTEAAILGAGKLAELTATGDWLDGEAEGDFGDEWPDYSWQLAVAYWEELEVSQLDLTVTWISRGRERTTTLSTLAYAPEE